MIRQLSIVLLFGWFSNSVQAQDFDLDNVVYAWNIRSIELLRSGELERSQPFVPLGANHSLYLAFDDLNADVKNYQYTFIHCNADWTPSDLLKAEYLATYQQEIIRDYNFSFNTFIPYTHYSLSFPNQYIQFTKSGNYLLVVYLDTPEEPAFTLRFVVYEEVVNISAQTHRATTADQMAENQQVDFSIFHGNYPIPDPFRDLKVTVLQNQRWDQAIYNLKPRFLSNNTLNYDYDLENNFGGGNEFREFDTKNTQSQSLRIRNFRLNTSIVDTPFFMANVVNEDSRRFKQYTSWQDINGRYQIRQQDSENSSIDADYIKVVFFLQYDYPLPTGCYLFGQLTNWKISPQFELQYDNELQAYTGEFFFKQGFYNYQYATLDPNGSANTTPFEGNHWQTENEYTVIVYHREIGIRYDRVIGITAADYLGN